MPSRSRNAVPFIVPLVIVLFWGQWGSVPGQTTATAIAAIVTAAVIPLAARFAWTPLLGRFGLWRTSVFLGCAIVAAGLAAAVARIEFTDRRGLWNLSMRALTGGLLFSWAVAAIEGAQDGKGGRLPTEPADPGDAPDAKGRRLQ